MFDLSHMGTIEIVLLGFLPTALAATQLQSKGKLGWLAIAGIALIAFVVLTGTSGGKLFWGAIALLAGLMAGGKVSDIFALQRMNEERAEEKRKRDARMK